MYTFGKTLIYLSAIISILFGVGYFNSPLFVVEAMIFNLIGHYFKHYFIYLNLKVSNESKPILSSLFKETMHTLFFITIFIFIGYLILQFSETEFYMQHLKNSAQYLIDLMKEVEVFWIKLLFECMKYGSYELWVLLFIIQWPLHVNTLQIIFIRKLPCMT